MPTTVGSEAELRRLFEAVVGGVAAPTADLVAAGLDHGRRLRRRHRQGMAMAAAAVTIAVTGTVALALGSVAEHGHTAGPATTSPATTGPATPEPMVPLEPRSAAALLASLFPAGGPLSNFSGHAEVYPKQWFISGELMYDDGNGLVGISAGIGTSQVPPWGDAPEGQRCGPTLDTCDSQVLPDGSELTTFEQHDASPSWGSVPMVLRGAVVRRPDGLLVAVSEINTVNQEGHWSARPTRSNLPISTDQLAAIAQSPVWQKTVPISIAEAGQRLDPFWLQPGTGASTPP